MRALIVLFWMISIAVYSQDSSNDSSTDTPVKPIVRVKPPLTPEQLERIRRTKEQSKIKDRIRKLKDVRLLLDLCDYEEPNHKLFIKKLINGLDYKKLKCLESKVAEASKIEKKQKDKEIKREELIKYFKNYKCPSLQDEHERKLCQIVKIILNI